MRRQIGEEQLPSFGIDRAFYGTIELCSLLEEQEDSAKSIFRFLGHRRINVRFTRIHPLESTETAANSGRSLLEYLCG
jgi:hypothetical protein